MATEPKTCKLRIGGMTCQNCQNKIEKRLRKTAGVESADVSYVRGTATVAYDAAVVSRAELESAVRKLGYDVLSRDAKAPSGSRQAAGALVILLALFIILRLTGLSDIFNRFPTAEVGVGYGMLFVIGLLTSIHCLAMCGGINLSQCLPAADDSAGRFAAMRPSALYNLGRVISYTLVGAVVGALGSVISFSGALRGVVQLAAGVFMVLMGVNMLGVFPALRKITPRLPRVFTRKIESEKGKASSPLVIGLLNGLMPCGPLQAMQLYALSTGSPLRGAVSMLLFSLGTTPLMFGLGALGSLLSRKFTKKVMTAGAALVVVLGLVMFSNGWSLSGLPGASLGAPSGASAADIVIENGVQLIDSTLSSGGYPAITVLAGTPVRWNISAPKGSINGCNYRMIIDAYGISHQFSEGDNVLEFTPATVGKVTYTCWMGMIRGTITVVNPTAAQNIA
ncbi:MAG: sulfite exporter TauE/SafE family protein [Oscillospiraceae bacterium]|jgi:sulfite exporter TauE/SafE/copper chaperone CopZ|nr:sulfite exporter TauE/SafE family protein [Oscillospiraceae bacterium]